VRHDAGTSDAGTRQSVQHYFGAGEPVRHNTEAWGHRTRGCRTWRRRSWGARTCRIWGSPQTQWRGKDKWCNSTGRVPTAERLEP